MKKSNVMLLIGLVTLLVISACSPLVNLGVNGTQTKVLLVNVNIDTEYLTGPGQVYQKIGVLAAGQVVEAVGRSPDGNFLLIRDPANSGNLYWINSKNVTVPGNPNDLPVATPIATPTPVGGCPTPIGGGPTPVDCGVAPSTGGCPTPIGGGPTPVDCGVAPSTDGCPTSIGGGPTPVDCSIAPSTGGCPTPIGGGPTPISCSGSSSGEKGPTLVPGIPILRRVPTATLPIIGRKTPTPVK